MKIPTITTDKEAFMSTQNTEGIVDKNFASLQNTLSPQGDQSIDMPLSMKDVISP